MAEVVEIPARLMPAKDGNFKALRFQHLPAPAKRPHYGIGQILRRKRARSAGFI